MTLISQGAEAKLYKQGNTVIKERLSKGYRVNELDKKLRQFRTRREAKVLQKLKKIGVLAPELISVCDKEMKITMSFIKGNKLRDCLTPKLAKKAGKIVGKLHDNIIIHSDLTTSNMIVKEKEIYMIDFGLSFFSTKIEDMAVDIHLFEKALESRHSDIHAQCFDAFIEGYKKTFSKSDKVLKRLEIVRKRGRYKKSI
ncbi:Kae1-associated kinase Bud32 [Candidatus Woesearchaeota archaeon]|nr:MAG: Kae1-associated kinase Bud32 [Candidatus Woesearchaeota archaeon]